MQESTPISDEDYTEICGLFQESVFRLDRDQFWKLLRDRIATFCLQRGSPSAGDDPLENIRALRIHLSSQGSHSAEAALRAEIESLKETCRTQQRIITNLTFRHTLEVLPGPKPTNAKGNPVVSSTDHWRNFWTNGWNNAIALEAQAQSQGLPAKATSSTANTAATSAIAAPIPISTHPFNALLNKFDKNTRRQVDKIGSELYGSLSTNIHHFTGQFTINDDQWDVIPAAILHAIAPVTPRSPGGGVDWNQERLRY